MCKSSRMNAFDFFRYLNRSIVWQSNLVDTFDSIVFASTHVIFRSAMESFTEDELRIPAVKYECNDICRTVDV
jgi:hypothetical protein